MFQYKSTHIMSVNKTNPLQRYRRKIDVEHGCIQQVVYGVYTLRFRLKDMTNNKVLITPICGFVCVF